MSTKEEILYEDEIFNGVIIKAATLDKLIDHCLEQFGTKHDAKQPATFVQVFFLTYHWYITTEELLNCFLEIYDRSANNAVLSGQVCLAIKFWLDNFGSDFEKNDNALSQLNVLNTKVQDTLGNGLSSISLNLDHWYNSKFEHGRLGRSLKRESLNFNDMAGAAIGEQLLFLNWKGLKKIPMIEWMKYGKSAKTKDTPSLKEQISLFNDISKYVIAMVLNYPTAEKRKISFQKFLAMSRRLLELNDFNTCLAVIGGLFHSTITRLNKTKELLSNEQKLFLKETYELFSTDNNYVRYRKRAEESKGFVVPILGVAMKDLVALETAVPDYIKSGSQKLINFHKMVQVTVILEQILRTSVIRPNVEPRKELFNVIRVSLKSRYTEDDLYELSIQREPRVSGTPTVTESSEVFASWASGVNADVPDRETVEKHVRYMVEDVFKTYDVDKNGSINQKEFEALATNFPFIDSFAVLDVNCDGNISRQEMLNYFMHANSQEMTKEFLHDFQEQSFYSPHYCVYCMGFLWGIGKSGYRCKTCSISCHKDCRNHVVMECRPESKIKGYKKRKGSTDSHLYFGNDADKCPVSNGDVFRPSSQSFGSYHAVEVKTRERILRLEMENEALKKGKQELKSKLTSAESTINVLKSQLGLVRQQTVPLMLEQVERLNTCKETDV